MNTLTVRAIALANLAFGLLIGVGLVVFGGQVLPTADAEVVNAFAWTMAPLLGWMVFLVVGGVRFLVSGTPVNTRLRLHEQRTADGWRVRVNRPTHWLAMLAWVCFACSAVQCVGLVAAALSDGVFLSAWASIAVWVAGLVLVAALWHHFARPRWVQFDEWRSLLRWIRHRPRERFELPLNQVIGVELRIGEPTPLGRGDFSVVLHWRDDETLPREAVLARFGKYDDAEALARWLRERLGLGDGG
jgi:hypothetical protein